MLGEKQLRMIHSRPAPCLATTELRIYLLGLPRITVYNHAIHTSLCSGTVDLRIYFLGKRLQGMICIVQTSSCLGTEEQRLYILGYCCDQPCTEEQCAEDQRWAVVSKNMSVVFRPITFSVGLLALHRPTIPRIFKNVSVVFRPT